MSSAPLKESLESNEDFSLGTEFGKSKISKVINVEFKKMNIAWQVNMTTPSI